MSLKVLSANFTRICYLRTFVGALVNHQIVGFCKASLAEFAHKFTLWSHLTTKIRPTVVIINSHYRKHFSNFSFLFFFAIILFWQKYYKKYNQSTKFTSSQVCVENLFVCFFFVYLIHSWSVSFFLLCFVGGCFIFAVINSQHNVWNKKIWKETKSQKYRR